MTKPFPAGNYMVKLAIEILEQGVKYVWNMFNFEHISLCSSVFISNFEQLNAGWALVFYPVNIRLRYQTLI